MIQKIIKNKLLTIIILLSFHFLYRFILLSLNAFPFNADEAIVGLMAKHILQGENFLFFYGQSYMGSLDAYLVALGFLIFGEAVWVIRLVQIVLYALTITFFYLYLIELWNDEKIALISSLFLVFPTVNVVLYTTVSLGGYGEAFLFGAISLYLSGIITKGEFKKQKDFFLISLMGFLFGFGLFTNPISLTMIVPAIIITIYVLTKKLKRLQFDQIGSILIVSFLIGSFPFWFALFSSNGFATLHEITGSAVAVEKSSYFLNVFSHLINFLLFGITVILGLRPPWSVDSIGVFVLPIVLFFWLIVFYLNIKEKVLKHEKEKIFSLIGIFLFVLGGFLFTSFGVDPSGRYFLPIVFPLSALAGYTIVRKGNKFFLFLAVFVILFQIYGTSISAMKKPYITTQFYEPAQIDQSKMPELSNFLMNENEFYGFSNYWVSYPLAFLSDEKIISIPELPYHQDLRYTSRDNRIEEYNEKISNADRFFYITTKNRVLDNTLVSALEEKKINYEYKELGDFKIYYSLSKKFTPEELGITNEFIKN